MTTYAKALKEPSLTPEDERAAIQAWQEAGDRNALNRLLRSHTRMAWSAARRMTNDKAILEDLVSAGMIALIDAANRFDLSRDVRFNTYASWFIKSSILDAMVKAKGVVDVPARLYLDARAGRLDPIRNAAAIAASDVAATVDTGATEDGGAGTIVVCPGQTPEEFVAKQSAQDQVKRLLDGALKKLDPMEQAVIRKRLAAEYGDGEECNIALKVTRAKLGTIERRAMHRLRQLLQQSGFSLAMLEN